MMFILEHLYIHILMNVSEFSTKPSVSASYLIFPEYREA